MANKSSARAQLPFSTKIISFNSVDVPVPVKSRNLTRAWVYNSIQTEGMVMGEISFNFCSDKHLLSINKKYLKHNYFTDIITFDFCEGKVISGDIYISRDRVKENAKSLGVLFHVELSRVMIHGVLHLCGYKDKSPSEQKSMRSKENYYLSSLPY